MAVSHILTIPPERETRGRSLVCRSPTRHLGVWCESRSAPTVAEVKLVVQVPCLNEEETLPLVLSSIPESIPGIDEIVVVVVDDGSSDRTVEVARSFGVTEFVRHPRNQGLALTVDEAPARGRKSPAR